MPSDFLDIASSQPQKTQAVTTASIVEETVEEEIARKRKEKGKAPISEEATEQQRKVKARTQAQIDMDAEVAKKTQEEEVARFMEEQRVQKEFSKSIPNITSTYQPTEEEIEHMINSDPEVKKKAIELIADKSLTTKERSAQLADFILMKNDQALNEMIGSIKKNQKKQRQPSKVQVIVGMKKFLCHVAGWKMCQLKGKSHEEIEGLYYRAFRRDKDFVPMNSEEEARRFKRPGSTIGSEAAKKPKVQKSSHAKEGSKLSEE